MGLSAISVLKALWNKFRMNLPDILYRINWNEFLGIFTGIRLNWIEFLAGLIGLNWNE